MPAFSLTHRPRSFWLGVAAAAVTLGLLAAWGGTWSHNPWRGVFPRYVGVHAGNLLVISSVWQAGEAGVYAWQSDGWDYDAMNAGPAVRWRPGYTRIGNAYGGVPRFRGTLHAVTIPLWNLALPMGFLAGWWLRRPENWRRPGQCTACGYDLCGSPDRACPECGTAPPSPPPPPSGPTANP